MGEGLPIGKTIMKKTLFLSLLLCCPAWASSVACSQLLADGMTLTAYTSQCAAFGDEARYQHFLKAANRSLNQISSQNCQEATAKDKDGLPHPAARVMGKERNNEVLAFCVAQRKTAEQLLKKYGG